MSYRLLDVRSVTGETGAPCLLPISDAGITGLRAALAEYRVVFLRDQPVTPVELLALTRRLGPRCHVPHASPRLDGYPGILEVVDKGRSGNPRNVGGNWHIDMPFLQQPPAQSILLAKEVPAPGGDTQWAGLTPTCDALHDFLLDQAIWSGRSGFTCRYRWNPDAVAIRDNRCTQHCAIDDNGAGGRVMHRIPVEKERDA
ncbi:MAG: TauD/TfdA family dioxygenase [Alphaproteobacteria bacterium]|nr:TauD/TfdA family dioxygenase [Alphaproteobacteria bacterium]